MNRLSKDDLSQMNQEYFQSLDKQRLVEVAGNLHALAVEQLERLERNSKNSSQPPSSDSPFVTEEIESDSGRTQIANQEKNLKSVEEQETKTTDSNVKQKKSAQGLQPFIHSSRITTTSVY